MTWPLTLIFNSRRAVVMYDPCTCKKLRSLVGGSKVRLETNGLTWPNLLPSLLMRSANVLFHRQHGWIRVAESSAERAVDGERCCNNGRQILCQYHRSHHRGSSSSQVSAAWLCSQASRLCLLPQLCQPLLAARGDALLCVLLFILLEMFAWWLFEQHVYI